MFTWVNLGVTLTDENKATVLNDVYNTLKRGVVHIKGVDTGRCLTLRILAASFSTESELMVLGAIKRSTLLPVLPALLGFLLISIVTGLTITAESLPGWLKGQILGAIGLAVLLQGVPLLIFFLIRKLNIRKFKKQYGEWLVKK